MFTQGFVDTLNRIDGEGTYHRGMINGLTLVGEWTGLVDHNKIIQNHRSPGGSKWRIFATSDLRWVRSDQCIVQQGFDTGVVTVDLGAVAVDIPDLEATLRICNLEQTLGSTAQLDHDGLSQIDDTFNVTISLSAMTAIGDGSGQTCWNYTP